MSNRYCCLLASKQTAVSVAASKQSAGSVWHMPVAVCTVLNCWWWTERPSETCRVLLQIKWIWGIGASGWFYYRNIRRCTVLWTSNFRYIFSGVLPRIFLKVDTDTPWLTQFQVTQFQTCAILEIRKIRNNIFVRHAEFFPCRNKSIVRWKWRKSTAGRWHRRREGHAAADNVTVRVWIFAGLPCTAHT